MARTCGWPERSVFKTQLRVIAGSKGRRWRVAVLQRVSILKVEALQTKLVFFLLELRAPNVEIPAVSIVKLDN